MQSRPHVRIRRGTLRAVLAFALTATVGAPVPAAVIDVVSLADSGAGSLRQAVLSATGGDRISMHSLTGTLTLATSIDINKPLTLVGSGASSLRIAGSGTNRLFTVSSAVSISNLSLLNGVADASALVGGAIYNTGALTLEQVALRGNVAYDGGGAIYNLSTGPGSGQLTLRGCELSGNAVQSPYGIGGGAIVSTSSTGAGATLAIVNSTLANNTAAVASSALTGGALYASRGSVTLVASTLDGNHAAVAGANVHQGTVAGSSLSMRGNLIGDALLDVAAANADQDIFLPTGATVTSLGYNIVTRRPAGSFGASDAAEGTAPGVGALSANGGGTLTMKPAPTSPAIGFVPLAACLDETGLPLATDQRGGSRRSSGATTCEAGAFGYGYQLASVFSQKMHAGTPYRLAVDGVAPIAGALTVEPRVIDAGHSIVFKFAGAVSSVGAVRASDINGAAIGTLGAPVISGDEVSVSLSNVPDATRVKVSLIGLNGDTNSSVAIGFLVGDVIGSRTIGNTQVTATKARSAMALDNTSAIYDLNLSGRISAADIAAVKARNSRTLP